MNIYDIAKKAGVSTATISRVINNSPSVREITRRHVLAIIEQEGFTPNIFAQGLGLNTMKMVGLLCTDVTDVYYAKAVSILESGLKKNGINSILCCTSDVIEKKKEAFNILLQKRVDAIILIGSVFKELTDHSHIRKAAAQVPVIIINGELQLPNTFCVWCNEQAAVEQAVKLLCEKYLAPPLFLYRNKTFSTMQKLAGYKNVLNKLAIPMEENLILRLPGDFTGMLEKLEEAGKAGLRYCSAIAADDLLAVAVQKAAGPGLPVIGFNNSILAECATPALTSIDNCVDKLCQTAISVLMQLNNKQTPPTSTVFTANLVQRESFIV